MELFRWVPETIGVIFQNPSRCDTDIQSTFPSTYRFTDLPYTLLHESFSSSVPPTNHHPNRRADIPDQSHSHANTPTFPPQPYPASSPHTPWSSPTLLPVSWADRRNTLLAPQPRRGREPFRGQDHGWLPRRERRGRRG